MFSYDAKVFPLANDLKFGNSSVKARVDLVIDNALEIKNFRVMETDGQLWVAVPSQKGSKPDEATGKFKYYDEVRFIDPRGEGDKQSPIEREIKEFIKSRYLETISGKRAAATARHQERTGSTRKSTTQTDAMGDASWGDDF